MAAATTEATEAGEGVAEAKSASRAIDPSHTRRIEMIFFMSAFALYKHYKIY
jgi:hypothetical protein